MRGPDRGVRPARERPDERSCVGERLESEGSPADGAVAALPVDLGELERETLACTKCVLATSRTNVVFGVGDPEALLMFVGEGPGRDEDLAGEPFVGRSGALLDALMAEEIGTDRSRCYIANVVKCRPPSNRDPAREEIEACSPYLKAQVEIIAPRVIVTLGNFATRLLLKTNEGVTRLRGRSYPFGRAQLVPTYHPAAALRGGAGVLAEMRADFVRAKRLLLSK